VFGEKGLIGDLSLEGRRSAKSRDKLVGRVGSSFELRTTAIERASHHASPLGINIHAYQAEGAT